MGFWSCLKDLFWGEFDCKTISLKVYKKAVKQGYGARIATGTTPDHPDIGHRWVEYLKNGIWLVWDDAYPDVGKSKFTADALGYTTYYTSPPRKLENKIFIRAVNK